MEALNEVRNDELKILMVTLKIQKDDESEIEFIDELKKSVLLVPVSPTNNEGEFTFGLLSDENGVNYFQAYTDMDSFNKWDSNEGFEPAPIEFDFLAQTILNIEENVEGLTLNPFSENIVLNKQGLLNAFNKDKLVIEKDETCPKETLKEIVKVLKTKDKVEKAYLCNSMKNNIPGYVLFIDTKAKDKDKLFKDIGYDILKVVDSINLDIEYSKQDYVKEILKDKKPIYEKK